MRPSLIHFTSPDFWSLYHRLPEHARDAADKSFVLLKADPRHPSVHLKKIGDLWSARAGIHYRAVGMNAPCEEKGILWIWIGSHAEYDRFIKGRG